MSMKNTNIIDTFVQNAYSETVTNINNLENFFYDNKQNIYEYHYRDYFACSLCSSLCSSDLYIYSINSETKIYEKSIFKNCPVDLYLSYEDNQKNIDIENIFEFKLSQNKNDNRFYSLCLLDIIKLIFYKLCINNDSNCYFVMFNIRNTMIPNPSIWNCSFKNFYEEFVGIKISQFKNLEDLKNAISAFINMIKTCQSSFIGQFKNIQILKITCDDIPDNDIQKHFIDLFIIFTFTFIYIYNNLFNFINNKKPDQSDELKKICESNWNDIWENSESLKEILLILNSLKEDPENFIKNIKEDIINEVVKFFLSDNNNEDCNNEKDDNNTNNGPKNKSRGR